MTISSASRASLALLACAAVAACSQGSRNDPEETANDRDPPVLEVETPARGTMGPSGTMTVSGRVGDEGSGIAEVRVNGELAALEGDRFTIDLPAASGMRLFSTVATDAAGNEATDHRTALLGTFADDGSRIADGIVARLDGVALASLGNMIGSVASGLNLSAMVTAQNPVASTGNSCNDATVYVDSIQRSGIPVSAAPAEGGIQTSVSIRDLVVHGHVDYSVVCGDFTAGFTMTASSYDVTTRILPRLEAGSIAVGLGPVESSFQDFSLSVGGVPGFVESLIQGQVRDRVAAALRTRIEQLLPVQATAFLADFLDRAYGVTILGHRVELALEPTAMTWDDAGGWFVLGVSSTVPDAGGHGRFLSDPRPAPGSLGAAGLRVAVADDVLNQLFAGLWKATALDVELLPAPDDTIRAFFEQADRISVRLLLPPVISADTTTGTMTLALGDIVVEMHDQDDRGQDVASIAEFVISGEVDLSATLDVQRRLHLETGSPRVVAQILSQSETLDLELDETMAASFGKFAISQVADTVDDLASAIPIPGIPGVALTSPTFEPAGGYILLGGTLTAP